jgi:hypothetical protein
LAASSGLERFDAARRSLAVERFHAAASSTLDVVDFGLDPSVLPRRCLLALRAGALTALSRASPETRTVGRMNILLSPRDTLVTPK